MAIYRSDQAQLTFAVEAAPGGYPELASSVTPATGTDALVVGILPAGSRSLPTDNWGAADTLEVGDFIVIGTAANSSSEVRRIEFIEGTRTNADSVLTIIIDTPTGFYHDDNAVIRIVTALAGGTGTDNDKYITFIPGVYETIEVPDPEMAMEPRYFLGTTSKRNPYQFYKGQQTYTGSLGGFVLLDGRALRFPIGKVATIPMEANGTTHATLATSITINMNSPTGRGAYKGEVFIDVTGSHGLAPNDLILLYGGASTTGTSLETSEVRRVRAVSTNRIQLDAPLQFNHPHQAYVREIDTDSVDHYKHELFETVDLDSVTWHVHVRDSSETDANDFDRRYHGGKIGNLSLSAEEGGLLTCGWDGVNFLGMNHNQSSHSGFTGNLPFYTLMQPIRDRDIEAPGTIMASATSTSTATAEPYYYSQGQVKLFGSTIARVRSFSLSIANNEEPRYYLRRTMGRHRGPSEILEQRREYTMSVNLALPDAAAKTSSAASVFKELLLEGDYGSGMTGFNIELRFDRGTNDSIIMTIPGDGVAATGGNEQGAFINTAPHNISDANPMEVEAEVLFRNLKIIVRDDIGVYP